MSDAERKKDDKKDRDDDKDRERSSSRKDKDRDRKRRSRSRSRSKSRDRKDRSRSRRSRSRSRSPRRKRSRSRSRDKSPPASWRSRNRSPPPPRREGGSDRENPYAETRGDYRAYRYKAREAREAAPLDAMSAKGLISMAASLAASPAPRAQRPASYLEREKAEYERDQRTVFVYHLSTKTDEKQLIDFFAIAGKVNDVRLIADRRTRKHKGFGYIEFENKESVPKALMMSGQMLNSMSVMVKASEAEKNLLAQSTTTTAAQMASLGPAKVFVGNLHFNLGEDDIRAVFSPFGDIDMIQVAMDDQNQSKGYAFVHFRRMEDGKKAVNGLNGFELAGRAMKVNLETEASRLASSGGGGGGYGGSGANVSNLELDDDAGCAEGGGHSLNPQSRAALMQKLARGVMPSPRRRPRLPWPRA
eukprot:tig00001302_g8102.t1